MEIRTISVGDKLLDAVVQLWRSHSDTLGFMPKGAFEEAAQKQTLLAAVEPQGHFRGYVFFRRSRDGLKIAHLCVCPKVIGKGVARLLVDEVTARNPQASGVGLWCRHDFEANKIWPRLGFSPRQRKRGRGREGGELILWFKDHAHPDLLTPLAHDNRVEAVIDSCVYFDIVDADRTDRGEESRALLNDWLDDSIRLFVSQEIRNDMHRDDDTVRRERRERQIGMFDETRIAPAEHQKALDKLKGILPAACDEQTKTDYCHLAWTLAGKIPYFLTRDRPLLSHKEALEKLGVCVLTPGEFIRRIDELDRKEAYRPEEISGTKITFLIADDNMMPAIEKLADSGDGESPRHLVDQVRNLLAKPRDNLVRAARDSDGNLLALIGISGASTASPTLSLVRMPKSSVAPTLARFIAHKLIAEQAKAGLVTYRVTDARLPDVFREALLCCGFKPNAAGELTRPCRGGLLTLAEAQKEFGALSNDRVSREAEIWPAKITDVADPAYMIPINPTYASSLFDHGLASQTLFHSNPDVLMQDECVYYSGTRMGFPEPGRIIWYVSQGDGFDGTSAARACSFLIEAERGPAKTLFKKYRRFGVFDWRDVLKLAGKAENEITALRFSHTETFSQPIPWPEMRDDLKSPPAGPRPLDDSLFLKLYRRGMGL